MSTSVASVTKHFPSAQNGFTTTLASTISSGAATVPLNSVAGYSNGEVAVFVVDPSDASKKQTFTGTIDTAGVQVTGVVWTAGTNQTHTGGATVVDYATATHISMMTKGILTHADQDGTLKAGAVDVAAVLASDVVTTAKILDANVTTAKIANANVTADKLGLSPQAAFVATAETTTSTSYVDLTTITDSVTATIGANGVALVTISANILPASDSFALVSYAVGGATTVAPDDSRAIRIKTTSGVTEAQLSWTNVVTGLTPGSNTFKMRYRVSAGTGTFSNRRISAVPL